MSRAVNAQAEDLRGGRTCKLKNRKYIYMSIHVLSSKYSDYNKHINHLAHLKIRLTGKTKITSLINRSQMTVTSQLC